MIRAVFIFAALLAILTQPTGTRAEAKLIVSDCGSRHLPGCSVTAAAVTLALKAKNVKLSLVMTKDGQVAVFDDVDLRNGTDAADIFPEKTSMDGAIYSTDLTFDEIRELTLTPSSVLASAIETRTREVSGQSGTLDAIQYVDGLGRKLACGRFILCDPAT